MGAQQSNEAGGGGSGGMESIFGCMEPKRNASSAEGDKKDDQRYTILCASMDCSGGRSRDKQTKVSVGDGGARRGMMAPETPDMHMRVSHTRNDMTRTPGTPDTGLPGGVGVVFKAGPIGSGPVVKGIVPGGSADLVGGVEVGDELLEIDGGKTEKLPAMELAGRLIGPVGTKMDMVFARKLEDGTTHLSKVTLQRTRIR
mmetsp:Transcript_27858/g.54446  ORF Transcript_27858/g.54446 Transcript_27858/m.54446 type:complete len:200 (+) Transcript_27858:145-744(+)